MTETTRSVPGGNVLRCWRKYSRSDRLMRFRTAAPPAGRPMMIPRRTPLRLACATWSAKGPDLTRRPTFSARLKSAALTSRAARGKRLCPPPRGLRLSGASAPWPGVASAPFARPECSFAPETHACVCVYSGSADTCASSAPRESWSLALAQQVGTLPRGRSSVKTKAPRGGKNPFASGLGGVVSLCD